MLWLLAACLLCPGAAPDCDDCDTLGNEAMAWDVDGTANKYELSVDGGATVCDQTTAQRYDWSGSRCQKRHTGEPVCVRAVGPAGRGPWACADLFPRIAVIRSHVCEHGERWACEDSRELASVPQCQQEHTP